jgi:hypothetical protein
MPRSNSPVAILQAIAFAHSDVEEGIACQGTAVESHAFKVRKKTFLFAREAEMMLKLAESLPDAQRLAAQDPARYKAGAGGWVTVKLGAAGLPKQDLLKRWIAESYRLMAGPSGPAKPVKNKSKKKGTNRKP